MWPTFYIPFAIAMTPGRPSVVGWACAYTTFGNNITTDVPIPSGAQAGDLAIAYAIGNSFSNSSDEGVTMDTGWKLMQRLDGYFTGGTAGPLAWKWLDGSETDATFTFNNSINWQQRICIVVYRSINPDMPFGAWKFVDPNGNNPEIYQTPSLNASDTLPAYVGCFMGFGDSVANPMSGNVLIDNGDVQQSVQFIATGQTFWGTGEHTCYHVLYYPENNAGLETLLPYAAGTLATANWTKTGCTASDTQAQGPDALTSRLTPTNSGGSAVRKAAWTEVSLVAGQQYTLTMSGILGTGGFNGYYGYLMVDDGTDETSMFFEGAGFDSVGGSAPPDAAWLSAASVINTNECAYRNMVFTPTRTGTHKIWLGMTTVAGTPECTGFGGYYFDIFSIDLRRGYYFAPRNSITSRNDSGAAITGQTGVYGRMLETQNGMGNSMTTAFELRRAGGSPALIGMEQPDNGMSGYENSTLTGNYEGSGATESYSFQFYDPYWLSSAPAYPPDWGTSIPAKVYAEITFKKLVNNPGDNLIGLIDSRYPQRVTTYTEATRPNDYVYESDGTIIEDGVSAGTFTSWIANEVVGVGLNWTDHEITFYKNGTLIRTSSFTGDYPRWLFVIASKNNDGSANTFLANLTGPFDYLPSGFSAFDWQNEVT